HTPRLVEQPDREPHRAQARHERTQLALCFRPLDQSGPQAALEQALIVLAVNAPHVAQRSLQLLRFSHGSGQYSESPRVGPAAHRGVETYTCKVATMPCGITPKVAPGRWRSSDRKSVV